MRLRTWMRWKDVGDQQFADMVGVGVAAVRKWKSGARKPPLDRALRIAEITQGEVTLQELLPKPKRPPQSGQPPTEPERAA